MENNKKKIVNVFFYSSHSAGISCILQRMLFNKFSESKITEKKSYKYKIYTNESCIIFKFHEQSIDILKNLNPKNENIIILVYSADSVNPITTIDPLFEEMKDVLNENYKFTKFGLIGNKLDLIKKNNIKSIIEMGEKYAEKIKVKFLLTSAKTGKGDVFQFILDILNLKSKNETIKNKKTLIKEYSQFYKSKNLNNTIRCEKCKTKIAKILFHEKSNKIELFCKENHEEKFIYGYKDIMKLINKNCIICKKEFEEKNNDALIYCKICKNYICSKCTKKHEHKSDNDIISPYFAEDQLCYDHGIKNDLICLDCKSLICSFCFSNFHLNHKVEKVDNNNTLEKLINTKRNELKEQQKEFEQINTFYLDLINELKKLYNEYEDKISLVFKLKENIINQLELIKYNNELFNTVLNMKFNDFKVNSNFTKLSVLDKLTNFFEIIEQPIQITRYNICNGSKILKKFNLITNNESKELKESEYDKIILTDACNLDNDHCCVSFDDGTIKIYSNNDFKTFLKNYELYERKKGVNSIINYKNQNTLYVSGFEKIYEIKIVGKELSLEKQLLITHPNITFTKLCDYNFRKSILYTDDIGTISIYNFINKKESKINENLEILGINSVIDFVNINENLFVMKFKSYELNLYISRNSKMDSTFNRSININLERFSIMDITNSSGTLDNNKEQYKEISKLLYLDNDNRISDEKLFPENTKILGIVTKDHILVQEMDESNQIVYKIINLVNNKELCFGVLLKGLKKDWKFKLIGENSDEGRIYFVFVDPNFSMLEFSFNPKNDVIQEIGYLRNMDKSLTKNPNNKIIKIILIRRTFIIINSNGELFRMNY